MISINNLNFSYEGTSPYILEDINVHIPKGSYVSIIGENGSAKSTLVKLLLGLLKPINGNIEISTDFIGYVPQRMENFNSQFPITVTEVLNCHKKNLNNKDVNALNSCIASTGINDLKNKLIGNLSGGQLQKVLIARAIMGSPDLIFLDEPSTGIDVKSQEEIYYIIKHLNQKHRKTIISVEHNMAAALSNSTHILKLENRKGSFFTIEEFLKKSGENK
jgi:zinc transport system ATP-binding protein